MTATIPAWAAKLEDPDVQLGGHINALRGVRRCSQSDLGDVIGVTQTTMGKKLRGQVGITFTELLKLAEFFELSVEDLIPPKYAGERVLGVVRHQGLEPRTRCLRASTLGLALAA